MSEQPSVSPCDIADKYYASMRKQAGILKLDEVPVELPPKTDLVVMTQAVLDGLPAELCEEILRYRIGRLLILVGVFKEQPRLKEYYRIYDKKVGFTIYSRIYPGIQA